MKFTKGPWRVGIAGPNQCPTVGTQGGLMVAMVAHGEDHPTMANAQLIASSPAMYEALRYIADHSLEFDLDEIKYAALEALAEAEKEIEARVIDEPQHCGNSNHGWKSGMKCVLPKGHDGNHQDATKCWWR